MELLKALGKSMAFFVLVFVLWFLLMAVIAYSIRTVQILLGAIS